MPWRAIGNKIVKADSGKVVGNSTSHAKAAASVRARYANTKGENLGQRFGRLMSKKAKAF